MPILAIASKKGGVGKTTIALNLGHALARRGWRTLVADADPLGCIGLSVDRLNGAGGGLLASLAGGEEPAAAVRETRLSTLHLLPAGAGSDSGAGGSPEDAAAGRLGEALRSLEAERDLVVVDTASGLTALGRAAVAAADRVLVPIQAEPLALRTTHPVLDALGDLRTCRLRGGAGPGQAPEGEALGGAGRAGRLPVRLQGASVHDGRPASRSATRRPTSSPTRTRPRRSTACSTCPCRPRTRSS
ncbi:MAG: ParA family protein, partial [Thermoanaerobaculia bacterium]